MTVSASTHRREAVSIFSVTSAEEEKVMFVPFEFLWSNSDLNTTVTGGGEETLLIKLDAYGEDATLKK